VVLSGSDRRLIVLSKSLRQDLVLDQTPGRLQRNIDLTLGPPSGLSVRSQSTKHGLVLDQTPVRCTTTRRVSDWTRRLD
jgi:hypothetical protein